MHRRSTSILPAQVNALARAVAAVGSQASLARLLGLSQPTVWRWCHGHRRLPSELVLAVEGLSGVSRHDLRPDIYPREEAVADAGIAAARDHVACDSATGMQRLIA